MLWQINEEVNFYIKNAESVKCYIRQVLNGEIDFDIYLMRRLADQEISENICYHISDDDESNMSRSRSRSHSLSSRATYMSSRSRSPLRSPFSSRSSSPLRSPFSSRSSSPLRSPFSSRSSSPFSQRSQTSSSPRSPSPTSPRSPSPSPPRSPSPSVFDHLGGGEEIAAQQPDVTIQQIQPADVTFVLGCVVCYVNTPTVVMCGCLQLCLCNGCLTELATVDGTLQKSIKCVLCNVEESYIVVRPSLVPS